MSTMGSCGRWQAESIPIGRPSDEHPLHLFVLPRDRLSIRGKGLIIVTTMIRQRKSRQSSRAPASCVCADGFVSPVYGPRLLRPFPPLSHS